MYGLDTKANNAEVLCEDIRAIQSAVEEMRSPDDREEAAISFGYETKVLVSAARKTRVERTRCPLQVRRGIVKYVLLRRMFYSNVGRRIVID